MANPAGTSLQISSDLVICTACGTQYEARHTDGKDSCKICDDPRQFVPPEGQTFTTLSELSAKHHNICWQDKRHANVYSFQTEPKFAIGNRCELLQTPHGNILFDLIPFLDQETVNKFTTLGGIQAIVISHPHYYSTWADWSRTFKCPVYVAEADKVWLERTSTPGSHLEFLTSDRTPIKLGDGGDDSGATTIVAGGHFPGSLLMHYQNLLFIADTIFTVPSATNPVPGKSGVISFSFFWSIPNRIPLPPDDILMLWRKVRDLDFETCFGAFEGMDVYTMDNERGRTGGVKGRLLESCKIFVRGEGYRQHQILAEQL